MNNQISNIGNKLTKEYLISAGFKKNVIISGRRTDDELKYWEKGGVTLHEDSWWLEELDEDGEMLKQPISHWGNEKETPEILYSFATYVRGDGSFKSGFVIRTDTQLDNLYYSLTGMHLKESETIKIENTPLLTEKLRLLGIFDSLPLESIHETIKPFLSKEALEAVSKEERALVNEENNTNCVYFQKCITGETITIEHIKLFAAMINKIVEEGLVCGGVIAPIFKMPLMEGHWLLMLFIHSKHTTEYLKEQQKIHQWFAIEDNTPKEDVVLESR